jgi:Asp-tRNA(Asn)/Glu-tRNA(Gln) amidotransferase A subunit family amidase
MAAELPAWAWPSGPVVPAPGAAFVGPWSWRSERDVRGIRLAVKENISLAGRPLRAGSPSRAGLAPESSSAPVVEALIAAGATVAGTVRMHELAFGVTGRNDGDGTVANPADPGRLPGGSSSGSAAAVALDDADVALATDTGGSARIPAALCGVVGMKAGRGVGTAGVLPLAPSLDHLGWITRDVATSRWVATALGLTSIDLPRPRPRMALVRESMDAADPSVAAAISTFLTGHDVTEVSWPRLDLVLAVTTTIMFAEAARLYDAAPFGPDVRRRLEWGATVTEAQYDHAVHLGAQITDEWNALTDDFDIVAAPTCGITAPRADEPVDVSHLTRVTRLDDLTGWPALSLPLPTAGLPIGLHLSGRSEAIVLAAAATLAG